MGFLDQLKNTLTNSIKGEVKQQINHSVNNAVNNAVKEAGNAIKYAGQNKKKSYTFASLPQNVEELKALPEAALKDEFAVVALTILALVRYNDSVEDCHAMLNFLKGPEPLGNREIQFMKDRFAHQNYVARSYFKGATPENDYIVEGPYTIEVMENPYSRTESEPDYAKLFVQSGGADSPREIRVRKKPSTGEWFLWDQMVLSDIRPIKSTDAWA